MIAQLQLLLANTQPTTNLPSTVPNTFLFKDTLKQGMTDIAVKYLQIILNQDPDTQVAQTGIGSKGKETTYFGPLTKQSVIKFQEKYKDTILKPLGLIKGTGIVGKTTKAKLNQLLGK
jgi:peptidoglycan hydrolase-like protein with peptidoglycan-binding domain